MPHSWEHPSNYCCIIPFDFLQINSSFICSQTVSLSSQMYSSISFWLKGGNTCFPDLSPGCSHFYQQAGPACPSILKLWRTNPNTTSHTATRAISEGARGGLETAGITLTNKPCQSGTRRASINHYKTAYLRRPKRAGRCLLISARGKINGLSRNNVSPSYCWSEPPEEVSALLSERWVQGQWVSPSLQDSALNAHLIHSQYYKMFFRLILTDTNMSVLYILWFFLYSLLVITCVSKQGFYKCASTPHPSESNRERERRFLCDVFFDIEHQRWSCCRMRDLDLWHFEGYWVVNINFSDNVWTWIHSDQRLSENSDNCAKYFTQSESGHRVSAVSCQQRNQ